MSLEQHRVPNIPPAAYYIPDFITQDEEEYLLKKLEQSPQPKWKTVGSGRRLQYWGGTMSKGGVLLPEKLPDFLTTFPNVVERISAVLEQVRFKNKVGSEDGQGVNINQVLVNEYLPGQGISPHEDGPAFHPLVATLSLGSYTILDIHHYISEASPSPPMIATEPSKDGGKAMAAVPLAHLLLLPRSLLVLSSSLYTSHLHGISERAEDVVVKANHGEVGESVKEAVVVANEKVLEDATVAESIERGAWKAERHTRTSLTFRQAVRSVKGRPFSAVGGLVRK